MYYCLNILLTCVRKGKQRENVREFMVSDHLLLYCSFKCTIFQVFSLSCIQVEEYNWLEEVVECNWQVEKGHWKDGGVIVSGLFSLSVE